MDLDTDSDNDNNVDRTDAEDAVEDVCICIWGQSIWGQSAFSH